MKPALDPADLTPERIVRELDKHIVGQGEAKRVVAIAIRNRYRRMRLPEDLREETAAKNILLIGPTGVGKTEIARRLAALVGAPFLKVEATRYTEVGYVGRDVESMVRDLVEIAVRMVRTEEAEQVGVKAEELARERLLDLLVPGVGRERDESTREKMRRMLLDGQLQTREVEIQVEERQIPFLQVFSGAGVEEMGMDLPGGLGSLFPARKATKRLPVPEALRVLTQQETDKLIDRDRAVQEGLDRAQNLGILFIDEIDKIVAGGKGHGPDVSREGVQRDLLPIVEGATVVTRYGPVRTDHVLFIAAGAFSATKPSDLVPELQGRFPLRAELSPLRKEDFVRILREPQNAILRQAAALLATEGVEIEFTDDAVEAVARAAAEANASLQDIGARRLHTIVERVVEDVSFRATEIAPAKILVNAEFVRQRLEGLLRDEDLRRYIL